MLNVCVDFDGVLNNYTGWKGVDELYTPREGAKEFLLKLHENYKVIIFSTRDNDMVSEWLDKYDLYYDFVTSVKVGAVAYIDDRGIKFNGDYNEVLDELNNFKAHWEVGYKGDDDMIKEYEKILNDKKSKMEELKKAIEEEHESHIKYKHEYNKKMLIIDTLIEKARPTVDEKKAYIIESLNKEYDDWKTNVMNVELLNKDIEILNQELKGIEYKIKLELKKNE